MLEQTDKGRQHRFNQRVGRSEAYRRKARRAARLDGIQPWSPQKWVPVSEQYMRQIKGLLRAA